MSDEHKCPNCGAFPIERPGPLEAKLAEAQAAHLAEHRRHLAAVKAGVELCQERDALKAALAEAQIQITYEQERNRNNVGMADEEIGRLKAALEQAREALNDFSRAFFEFATAAVRDTEEPFIPKHLSDLYGVLVRRAQTAESVLAGLDAGKEAGG